jgi:prepilin-type N-terminal cleavage/methylation domain-containing protein/prepilin-type processing-associated H-X9-DG protein
MYYARSKRTGFTLIELLVVIAIIAILAAILFPVFAQARNQARKATCISNLKQIALAQLMYVQDYDEQFTVWDWGKPGGQDSWVRADGSGWWMVQTVPYIKNYGLYACPNDTRAFNASGAGCASCGWGYAVQQPATNPRTFFRSSYGISEWLVSIDNSERRLAGVPAPASTAMYADSIGPLFNDWDECGDPWPFGFTRVWYANNGEWGSWGNDNDYEANKRYSRHGDGNVISYVDGHAGYLPNRAWKVQRDPNGVCPAGGKKQFPVVYPQHVPY